MHVDLKYCRSTATSVLQILQSASINLAHILMTPVFSL